MKKFLCIVLTLFILSNTAFAYGSVDYDDFSEYKSKYRILYGAILLVGGAVLSYDGFRKVKVNDSRPEVTINFNSYWYTTTDPSPYYQIKSSGTVQNTGNVDLRNVTFYVRYKDEKGEYVNNALADQTQVNFSGFSSGETINLSKTDNSVDWSHEFKYLTAGRNLPDGHEVDSPTNPQEYVYRGQYPSTNSAAHFEIADVQYEYDKIYKKEMNNAFEGVAGLLLIGGGAYLLIDYLVSVKKFDYYMKKKNIKFYVENNFDEFAFKLSKKI